VIYLAVDNTKPLPPLAANDDDPEHMAEFGRAVSRAINRLAWLAFWIGLGLVAGVAI
jgi:hypothetical protein